MKICMGGKKGYGNIGETEPHFGYPFVIQSDRTLRCEVTGKMAEVASMDIKAGRIAIWYPPKEPVLEIEANPESEPEVEEKAKPKAKPGPKKKDSPDEKVE